MHVLDFSPPLIHTLFSLHHKDFTEYLAATSMQTHVADDMHMESNPSSSESTLQFLEPDI